MNEEELTGRDYWHYSLLNLSSHPDFSRDAFAIMIKISQMTTAQLEKINLNEGEN